MAVTENETAKVEVAIPKGLKGYLRATGPGILVAMAWLSAGDLISSSVSGATYGYALLWTLVIALIARYFFVSAIGKYVLCNNDNSNSIMAGFGRLWRWLPVIVGSVAFILGFTYQTYIIKGAALALYNLTGRIGDSRWGVFAIAVILVAVTIAMLLLGRQYRTLEVIARVSVAVLIAAFLAAVALQGFDPVELLHGISFKIPENTGAFGAMVLTAATIGAVGGSAANLLYPYFLRDKGWRAPAHRKLQIFDLLLGIAAMIIINLAIWITAAESLSARGAAIDDANDLAAMMGNSIGAVGPVLLWIGVFFVTFNSFPAFSYGFTHILLDGIRHSVSRSKPRTETTEGQRGFRWVQIVLLLLLPLPFSLPMAPNFVALSIAGNALGAMTGPIIIVGVIVLTSSRRFMLDGHVNRWWETLALLIIGGIGLWATYGVIAGLLS